MRNGLGGTPRPYQGETGMGEASRRASHQLPSLAPSLSTHTPSSSQAPSKSLLPPSPTSAVWSTQDALHFARTRTASVPRIFAQQIPIGPPCQRLHQTALHFRKMEGDENRNASGPHSLTRKAVMAGSKRWPLPQRETCIPAILLNEESGACPGYEGTEHLAKDANGLPGPVRTANKLICKGGCTGKVEVDCSRNEHRDCEISTDPLAANP